jgi:hypothetical protein
LGFTRHLNELRTCAIAQAVTPVRVAEKLVFAHLGEGGAQRTVIVSTGSVRLFW